MMPVAIGIDLGTTNSCVGWWNKDKAAVDILPNPQGHRTTPSYVAFTDQERLVGDLARKQQLKNPDNTIYEFKRFIGRPFSDQQLQSELKHSTHSTNGEFRSQFPFQIVDVGDDKPQFYVTIRGEPRLFYPEEIAAMILTHMKENAEQSIGCQVPRAVITVPAYFNDAQRQATRDAGYIAGLEVLRIINEPTAAAIAYGLDKKPKELEHEINILVFDLGGGTLDTSLLTVTNDGIFEVKAIAGDTRLGGADFDQRLIDHCARAFRQSSGKNVFEHSRAIRKLRTACEQAKCELSNSLSASIYIDGLLPGEDLYINVTRAQFENMCSDLFNRCLELTKKTLSDARILAKDIEDVVLVGGSTRIPKIQEMLSGLFADTHTGTPKKLCKSINPDEAVAYGAAIQAAMLNYLPDNAEGVYRSEEEEYDENLPDYVLLDVNPLSLGLETSGGLMNVIIPRNTTIPITKTKIFSTVEDDQTAVTISVFEGERSTVEHNRLLGEFELGGIEPQERGMPQIEVTFAIDADGIFTVRAKDTTPRKDGTVNEDFKTLTIKHSKRNEYEVEKLVNNAKQFEAEDAKYRQLVRTKNQFVNLLYATRNLIYKDEKVANFIIESDKKLLEETLKSEMEWVRNEGDAEEDKSVFEQKIDYIQNDLVQPIIDKINKARRATDANTTDTSD